jgi:phage tail sheath protein FI
VNGRGPGVYIEPADPSVRPVAPARTDVAAFVGIAERGPLNVPTRVTSFKEFTRVFGSFIVPGFLAYAVRAFFENRGVAAWIVRAAANAIGTSVSGVSATRLTLAPALAIRPGTVVALLQHQSAPAAAGVLRHVVAADPGGAWIELDAPPAGVDAREVPPLDLTQPMFLSTGATNASVALLARDGTSAAVCFSASSPGSWGNRVALRVMRESIVQTTVAGPPAGGGSELPVDSIARFSRGTFVRVRQGAQAPAYRVVCDVDPVTRSLVLASNLPGRAFDPAVNVPLPASFTYDPSTPMTVDALAIHLLVLESGAIVEDYPNCSPLLPHAWSAQLVAANSRIALDPASLPAPSLDPDVWPADVDAHLLLGATDGVRMLAPADLTSAMATLAPVREPTMVAIPDACAGGDVAPARPPVVTPPPECTDPQYLVDPYVPPLPVAAVAALPPAPQEAGPGFTADQTALVMQALVDFCDTGIVPDSDLPPHPSFRFALVDVPGSADPLDFRHRFDASRAAIHWPWAGVYDPIGPAGGVRFVPPSGHVAGAFAATDLALGAHHSAANGELTWIVGLAAQIDGNAQPVYNDAGINVIRALPNRGIRIYGARTLSSDASWLYVPVRRLVSMIENAVLNAMQWAVFEPNNPTLRALVRRSCLTLLDTLWQSGAFAGPSRDGAYYVICDGSNNSPSAQANGLLQVDIGIAPVRPAEFIVFRVGHQHDTLEVFEGTAA